MRSVRGPRFGLGIVVLIGVSIAVVECGASPESPSNSSLTIVDGASVQEVKAEFNRAAAAARLVLLLSPT